MAETVDNKAQVKAWLLHLLAELEIANDAEGNRTEIYPGRIIIDIQLKS